RAPERQPVELALDYGPCVRSKLRAAHRPHTHAVNFQLHLSKAHTPARNLLAASRAVRGSAVLPDPFRPAERKQSTFRKGCELESVRLAFRRCGTHRTVPGHLAPGFQRR